MIRFWSGKVLDIRETFVGELKKYYGRIIFSILFSILWSYTGLHFWAGYLLDNDFGLLVLLFPWITIFVWIGALYASIRRAFWIQLALTYGWVYIESKNFTEEKALLFSMGHSRRLIHGIAGKYNNLPFHIYEYQYSKGSGKNEQSFIFTVFEVKFSGTFPHLYLNYKKDHHSNPPDMGSVAKLQLPKEFENKFDFYSPREYEIETLEIF